jgi:FMN-dependent NADH-azoreductase
MIQLSNLLVLHNSINLTSSATRDLASNYIRQFRQREPHGILVERDLVADPIPHLPPELRALTLGGPAPESPDDFAILAETLITELEQADTIVIGVPMYSFSVPSALKAWFDYVIRVGRTFAYVDGQPKALLPGGKKVVLLISTGGIYSGPLQALDFTEPYLRAVLGFLGITDIKVVRVEAQGMGPDLALSSRAAAREALALV